MGTKADLVMVAKSTAPALFEDGSSSPHLGISLTKL